MIIINADDFGYNDLVNQAILKCFKKKYIDRTTIMVNMPGFENAVEIANEYNLVDSIGLHLNFFDGYPLTEEIKEISLFYDKSSRTLSSYAFFHKCSKLYWIYLPKKIRTALKKEAEAQVLKYKNYGFKNMHFDSHGHCHTIPSIFFAIKGVLKENGMKSSRISKYSKSRSIIKKMFKLTSNFYIKHSFNTTDYFLDADDFLNINISATKSYEVMVHPRLNNDSLINNGSKISFEAIMKKKYENNF